MFCFPFYVGKALPATNYRFVDVRDVASAHIQAFELPSASGRYCLVSHFAHISEALKIIRQLYPTLNIPERYIVICKVEQLIPVSLIKITACY